MCFSAPASFIAGAVTSGVSAVILKDVKEKREIPLALIPLFFGIQQFIEGGIWLSFNIPILNNILTFLYIIFSHILWPFYIPLAVFLVENHKIRKRILLIMLIVGIFVAIYFLVITLTGSFSSNIINNSIAYYCNYIDIEFIFGFYVLATCVSCMISSHRFIRLFGLAVILSALIAYSFYITTFTSIWCFFGAILSLILLLHFKRKIII